MAKISDIQVRDVSTHTETIAYRTPIKFGGRVVTSATLLNVSVEVTTRDGRRATGFGSMPLGNAWAWPSKVLSGEQTEQAMETLGRRIADQAINTPFGDPLEIVHGLSQGYSSLAESLAHELELAE